MAIASLLIAAGDGGACPPLLCCAPLPVRQICALFVLPGSRQTRAKRVSEHFAWRAQRSKRSSFFSRKVRVVDEELHISDSFLLLLVGRFLASGWPRYPPIAWRLRFAIRDLRCALPCR